MPRRPSATPPDPPRRRVAARMGLRLRSSRIFESLRLLAFAACFGGTLASAATQDPIFMSGLALPSLGVFAVLVVLHQPVLRKLGRDRLILRLIDARESRVGEVRRSARTRLIPPEPASALDAGLAVFRTEAVSNAMDAQALDDLGALDGPGTLRGLADVCRSPLGSRRIERWLTHPSLDPAEIRARQDAARYLLDRREILDRLEQAFEEASGTELATLPAFLARPAGEPRLPAPLAPLLAPVVPGLLLLAVLLQSTALFSAALIAMAANHAVAARHGPTIVRARSGLLALAGALRLNEAVRRLVAAPDAPPLLRSAREALRDHPEHGRLRRLAGTLAVHRMGLLGPMSNWLCLFEVLVIRRCLRRLADLGPGLEAGIGAAAEVEAMASLARSADEIPGTIWPEILDAERPRIEAVDLRHPLLPPSVAVGNDLTLGDGPTVLVITGSNMAGKSTFLRAVASNALLAGIGAPVRAARLRLTPLRILTDIIAVDRLADGRSTFEVEVERVGSILAAAGAGSGVLAVIDEIFRGTNAAERVSAGMAVVRHLLDGDALVLLATHDAEFAGLAAERPGRARNVHFRDVLSGDRLEFPRILSDGVARTGNAIEILARRGFPAAVVADARRRRAGRAAAQPSDGASPGAT